MRKFFLVALMAVAALTLAACDSKKEATAYGLVHGHYVGEVTVTVAEDGTVGSVSIEEYFLPYSWAKVSETTGDVLAVVGSRGTSNYAKYVKIGDKLFTGSVTGTVEEKNQVIVYSAEGIANIETWVENAENAEWYVKQINANKFFLADSEGKEVTNLTRSDATSNKSMKKSESGYWFGENYPLGWAGNVAAMVEAFVGTKLEATVTSEDQDPVTKFWSFGDVETGATLTDFIDYYTLAQAAFNAAK